MLVLTLVQAAVVHSSVCCSCTSATATHLLAVGKEFFKAHKDVLCAASDYFSAMFSHDMMEKEKDYIELQGISLEGFQSMLEYFYHGHITLDNKNVESCIEAGTYFQVFPH